ncbi:uncharacterized protein [Maniola hyperantus]|uniref:uncharacterized protein isoform X2 n=1 Tax=Aphantopus hyperantus TaxID=2795564 RepID=UPI003749DF1B
MEEDSEWLTCPYDRAHRVPALRVQRHLVKCEARHPPLAICPFNATHRMSAEKMALHVEECPTRAALGYDVRAGPERALAALVAPRPTALRSTTPRPAAPRSIIALRPNALRLMILLRTVAQRDREARPAAAPRPSTPRPTHDPYDEEWDD